MEEQKSSDKIKSIELAMIT